MLSEKQRLLLDHGADGRASAALVHQIAHLHPLVSWALFLDFLQSPLEIRLALPDFFQLLPQTRLPLTGRLLALLQLTDTVAEEVVDELHLGDAGLESRVLGSQGVVGQRGLEVRAVDGRVGRRGCTQAEAWQGGGMEVAVEGLLEQMLGRNVGMAEVGGAGPRDGRLGAVGDGRRDLARCAAVLGQS